MERRVEVLLAYSLLAETQFSFMWQLIAVEFSQPESYWFPWQRKRVLPAENILAKGVFQQVKFLEHGKWSEVSSFRTDCCWIAPRRGCIFA